MTVTDKYDYSLSSLLSFLSQSNRQNGCHRATSRQERAGWHRYSRVEAAYLEDHRLVRVIRHSDLEVPSREAETSRPKRLELGHVPNDLRGERGEGRRGEGRWGEEGMERGKMGRGEGRRGGVRRSKKYLVVERKV
jgi:hypothetical protein